MKTLMIAFFFAVGLTGIVPSARADLADDAERLTPERAYLFQNKIQAKIFEPMPEGFFTRLSISVGGGPTTADPKAYRGSVSAQHGEDLKKLGAMKANLMWHWGDAFSVGLMMGGVMGRSVKEIAPSTFQDIRLSSMSLDFGASYRVDLGNSWFITPGAGLGFVVATVDEQTTSDATQSTYLFHSAGIAPHWIVELPVYYRLNSIWSIGLSNAFQFANITKFERARDKPASTAAVNLSGYQLTFNIGINL